MASIFYDSFDHYAVADIERKWTKRVPLQGFTTGTTRIFDLTEGRRSTDGLKTSFSGGATQNGASESLQLVFPDKSTVIFGFAFKQTWSGTLVADTNSDGSTQHNIWKLSHLGVGQLWARLNLDNTLSILRGNTSSAVLGTSSFALNDSLFFYLEFKITIHDSTGSVAVRRDGMTILSLSNIDTRHTSDVVNSITIGKAAMQSASSMTLWYDDFYLIDDQGGVNDDFLNDIRVDALLPNANGNSSQWTRSTGADQFATIDEQEANGDTDYNSTATIGDKDTLGFPNAPVSGVYKAVQVNMMCRKEDSGPAAIKAIARVNSTDHLGEERGIAVDYRNAFDIFDVNPDKHWRCWRNRSLTS